jgi:hypothetical protein
MRGHCFGHLQVDHTGFYNRDTLLGVNPDNSVESVEGNHKAIFNGQGATREAGAAPPGDKGHTVLVAETHGLNHFGLCFSQDNRCWVGAKSSQGIRLVRGQLSSLMQKPLGRKDLG